MMGASSSFKSVTCLIAMLATCVCHAELRWEASTLESQTQPNDAAATFRFQFQNHGEVPVSVLEVKASCSCTAASPDKRNYAPGEKGTIKA